MSNDEMLDYLRVNGFRSSRQLEGGRKPGDPNVFDYKKAFGSWAEAVGRAFGAENPFRLEVTGEYLAKVVSELGLWTRAKYLAAREAHPEEVPSYWYVEKEFKRWGNLRYCAEQYDAKRTMALYVRFFRQLGREPTPQECRDREINKYRLERLFGGRRLFRQCVKQMVAIK